MPTTACLFLVMGEFGHIVTYAFCESERDLVAQRLFHFLTKRMERLGGPFEVNKVIAVYSDKCCNNAPPENHWTMRYFPSCTRAPLKDIWHGNETVARTLTEGHSLRDAFKSQLWSSTLKCETHTLNRVLDFYKKSSETGKQLKDRAMAKAEMMKQQKWRKRCITSIPRSTRLDMATDVSRLCLEMAKMDDDYKKDAQSKGISYRSLFTTGNPHTNTVGTKEAVDHLVEHLRKGCFSDPLPPREMCYPVSNKPPKDGGPPTNNSKRGTNLVEAGNRTGLQEAVANAKRQGSDLTHARYLVHTCNHNSKVDAKIEHLTGEKARPRDWFIMEALSEDLQQLTRTAVCNINCPPELDLNLHMEPIGELCQLCSHWEDRDREIAARLEDSPDVPEDPAPPPPDPEPAADEFGD